MSEIFSRGTKQQQNHPLPIVIKNICEMIFIADMTLFFNPQKTGKNFVRGKCVLQHFLK